MADEEPEVVGHYFTFEDFVTSVASPTRVALSPLTSPTGQVTIKW